MTEKYYTLKDVAELLHTEPYRIAYQLTTRKVPEPLHIAGRRAFTGEDIQRIAAALGIEVMQELKAKGRRQT